MTADQDNELRPSSDAAASSTGELHIDRELDNAPVRPSRPRLDKIRFDGIRDDRCRRQLGMF